MMNLGEEGRGESIKYGLRGIGASRSMGEEGGVLSIGWGVWSVSPSTNLLRGGGGVGMGRLEGAFKWGEATRGRCGGILLG